MISKQKLKHKFKANFYLKKLGDKNIITTFASHLRNNDTQR